ncbi:murein biosynthesis integral membrane protein MurJ [Mucilaginibacter sp. Mucisp86]|uniref:murein biosynthesis integral membrane protein MurJ n=1 Tax=Mucilaginibacter sp. Mucisp86 TaxID=3243060 RepID=UPI0039B4B12A
MKFKSQISEYFKRSSIAITIGLGALKFIKAFPALLIIILSAKYFGISPERDAWLVGVSIITVSIQLLFGPLNETFITKYIHIREEQSLEDVNKATDALISTIIIISIFVSAGIFLFSHNLADIFAPGFSDKQKNTLVFMLRILIPSLLMLEITNIWSSILNAYKSYFIPDLLSSISLIINTVLIVVLSPIIGIYSLVVSAYLGYALLTIVLYRELRFKFNYRFKFVIPKYDLIKPFFLFALPLFINYLFSQTDSTIEKSLTTEIGSGSVSVLDYARKFSELPSGLLMGVVTTVLTPLLSLFYVKNTEKELINETQKYFRFMILIVLPIAVTLIVLPHEIVKIVLVRGKFGAQLIEPTSMLLKWYGIGLFTVIFYLVYTQLIIAQKKIYFFSKVVIISFIVKIAFNLALYKKLGLNTFPMSSMISNFIMGLILLYVSTGNFRKKAIADAAFMIFFGALLTAICYGMHLLISNFFKSDYIVASLVLIAIFAVELMLVLIFRLEEAAVVKRFFKRFRPIPG